MRRMVVSPASAHKIESLASRDAMSTDVLACRGSPASSLRFTLLSSRMTHRCCRRARFLWHQALPEGLSHVTSGESASLSGL